VTRTKVDKDPFYVNGGKMWFSTLTMISLVKKGSTR